MESVTFMTLQVRNLFKALLAIIISSSSSKNIIDQTCFTPDFQQFAQCFFKK
jgi:hypothetical protein